MYFIPTLYGIIVVFANICGNLIPNFFNASQMVSYDIDEWMRFLNENPFTTPVQFITFLVPIIWCVCYIRFSGEKKSEVLSASEDEDFKNIAVNVAHYHHEKWNGEGYPEKISGEQIPFEARIMALADVFDALVSKRCYKDSFSYDKAFEIIQDSLGTHFDPELGGEFIKCRARLEALYNGY